MGIALELSMLLSKREIRHIHPSLPFIPNQLLQAFKLWLICREKHVVSLLPEFKNENPCKGKLIILTCPTANVSN